MGFLNDIFEYLNKNCNYAVLRNFNKLPDSYISNDIDMIMTEKEYDYIKADIYNIAKKWNYLLIQYYKDERFVTIFFQKIDKFTSDIIELDFFFAMSAKGILMMTADEILKNRQFNGHVYHVCLVDEVLDKCLCNGIFGVPYPEKYMNRYQLLNEQEHNELNKKLQKVFGCEISNFEMHQHQSGKKLRKAAMVQGCRNHHALRQIFFWFRHVGHLALNFMKSKGLFISFTGADGSGKTTAIKILKSCYESVFRGAVIIHHFRPDSLPRIAELFNRMGLKKTVDEQYSKPHRGKTSGFAGSLVRLIYYILDYQIGYLIKIRPQLFRRRIVIYDRYYSDIVADSHRSNIGLPYKIIDKIGVLVFQPKFGVLLIADPKMIITRKQELTEIEIEEINAKLKYMSIKKNKKVFINNKTSEEVVCEIMKWILDVQNEKLKKYMCK